MLLPEFARWNDLLVFLYLSDDTFWTDHPFCVLDAAGWSDDEQLEAAGIFIQFATGVKYMQDLLRFGIRPIPSAGINNITCCQSTIATIYGANPQFNSDTNPVIPYPTDDVMNEVLETWHKIKKVACIAMIVDTSGSMSNTDSFAKSRLEYAKTAVRQFLNSMEDHDYLVAYSFNDIKFSKASHEGLKANVRSQLGTFFIFYFLNVYNCLCLCDKSELGE
ncbi:von Willebrand factor type A [Reticulomyxa filosa]|uniref:von Willebrand factor type A n=1 Tax=Reticulomyxa filosa TaxID=46433 RepID=X6M1D7_RETFI|nr:von Willebrand factor type A [Reticulomyxa filosa]|eukprot:ETO07704.1 von Willebrand factor type A [Reticulomyxa filosa]